MGCFTVSRAISVRILFTTHGVFSIWRLYAITENPQNWYLLMALFGLAFETAFTLYMKRGQDWKWFCPSVFFYLACMVPTIWFLELHELDLRIRKHLYNNTIHLTSTSSYQPTTEAQYDLRAPSPDLELYPDFSDKLEGIIGTSGFDSHQWVRTLEQLLLLILILGRWMLPKGNLTHDQLSQLLLVYIGTAADIVEFFEAFNEEQVKYNTNLCTVILAIWSWSVLQFTLVFTATKSRGDGGSQQPDDCCTPDVFGIIMSIFMQDGPFLVLRMLLIFRYNVLSYTNMFFTCKNTLVCMLLLYRLIVIQVERYKQIKRLESDDSSSTKENKRLLLSMHNSDQYYNYSTKVILRELLQQSDVNEKLITYVVKRHLSHASSLADENYFNPPSGSGWSPSDYSFNSSDDIRTFQGREYSIGPGDLELLPIASYEVGSGAYTRSQTTSFTGSERQDSCVIELETGEYGVLEDLPEISSSQPVEDIVKLIFEATNSRLFAEETDSDSSLSAILRVKPPPPAVTEEPGRAGLGLDLSRLLGSTEADALKALPSTKRASRPAFIRPVESNHQTSVEPLQTISMGVHLNDLKLDSNQISNAQVHDGLLNNKKLTSVKHSDSKLLHDVRPARFKSMMKSGWCR